jgi:hypothetical protein
LPWSTRFEDPIVLPNGRKLVTLKDAADYVMNRHVERVFNPDRKETHWGKRKLKREE